MNRFKILIILICSCFWGYSQKENTVTQISLESAIQHFQNKQSLKFSYDPQVIKNLSLRIDTIIDEISIIRFTALINEQTDYELQKIDPLNYILVLNTNTYTVCGKLVDQLSNFELSQATILKNNKAITLSDANGFFYVDAKQQDSISISYLGYKSKTIIAKKLIATKCATIYLNPKVEALNDVIIEEYLTKGIFKKEDASIYVSTKDLRILPGLVEPDVLQSAQLLPGVSSPTEDPASLYIRGGSPDQNLILWDGIKIYNTGHFFNQISTFNPYITNSVEVYRGGTSVQYGDRISGVVNITSDNDLTEGFKIGGGFNLTHADIYTKIPLSKKAGLLIAGRRSSTDIYNNIVSRNLNEKVFQNTRATLPENGNENSDRDDLLNFSDTNLKFLWNPNTKNNITFSSILIRNTLDNFRNNQNDNISQFNTRDKLKTQNFGASLSWTKKYNAFISHKLSLNTSLYEFDYNLLFQRNSRNFEFIHKLKNTLNDSGGEFSLDMKFKNKHLLKFGYQFIYNQTENFMFTTFTDAFEDDEFNDTITAISTNHTFYNEYIYDSKKAYLRLGLRNSLLNNSSNRLFIEPRIFASIEFLKNLRLTTSFELKNQQITQLDTFNSETNDLDGIASLPNGDQLWIIAEGKGDPDLRELQITKSQQFTLGLLYDKKGWNIDLEGYYKNLNDTSFTSNFLLLAADITDDFFINSTEKRWGIDFLLKKRIQNYRFWLSYSWNTSAASIPIFQENTFPNSFNQTHVFNISQTLKVKKFDFSLGWNYATALPFTEFTNNTVFDNALITISPDGLNSERFTKNYHRLDASATYRFSLGNSKKTTGLLGVALRNIYNRKNEIGQEFRVVVNENDNNIISRIKPNNITSLRFTPDFVFRLNF